ncbi:MAG: class I SAM-dependent methyltransferase [Rhodomicrobium sp.]
MSAFEGFWSGIGHQLKCPSGRAGRLTGRVMTVINKEPNRLAIDTLQIEPANKVLELGFGPGSAIRAIAAAATQGRVLGIDRSAEMLAQASRRNRRAIEAGRVELRLGRFDSLPWPSGTMDKILAVNVVYFFNENADEIREAWRILRPGGLMAVYATDRATMSHWKFSGPDTHALYGEAELHTLILRGGFRAKDISIRRVSLAFGVRGLLALVHKGAADGIDIRKSAGD